MRSAASRRIRSAAAVGLAVAKPIGRSLPRPLRRDGGAPGYRAGLRLQEALDLTELDLDAPRGSVLVRRGNGGRRREVGMDDWGFAQLEPWLRARQAMPVG